MDEIKGVRIVSLTGEKEYGIEDSEARQDVQQIVEGAPEALDTFKEIAEYIAEDGATAAEIIKNVATNARGIADEITRAKAAEAVLEGKIADEAARATAAEKELKERIDSIPLATTENDGLMSATDKIALDKATTDIKTNADAITAEKKRAEAAETKAKEDAVTLALRQLYIAAGAVYNESTGKYAISGVDDLSEEEMLHIYSYKDIASSLVLGRIPGGNFRGRVFLPLRITTGTGQVYTNNFPIAGTGAFSNTNIEVFKVSTKQELFDTDINKIPYLSNNAYEMFFYCTKLVTAYPLNIQKVTTTSVLRNAFKNNLALVELRLYGAKISIHIEDSPLLSKDSLLYIINNATPTSAITITLHADAYARLKDDADIVAALESQPLITLVSA